MIDTNKNSSLPSPQSLTRETAPLLQQLGLLKGHDGVVNGLSWSPDGALLATASDDRTAFVWNILGVSEQQTLAMTPSKTPSTLELFSKYSPFSSAMIQSDHWVKCVSWNMDGSSLALGGLYSPLTLWSPSTRSVVAVLSSHSDFSSATCISWSPDNRLVATANEDRAVRVWDAAGHKLVSTLRGNDADVNAVAFHPDGLRLATGGGDNKVRIWSIAAESLIMDLPSQLCYVIGVAWSPDGQMLAALHFDELLVWNVQEQKVVYKQRREHTRVRPTGLAFSPDGRLLAVPTGEAVAVLAVDSRSMRAEEVAELRGHAGQVTGVVFSPDGSLLATSSEDGTARVWGVRAA